MGDPENRVGRRWWLLLPLALLICLPASLITMGNPAVTALPQVLFAWLMSFGMIGLFRAALPSENKAVRYVSDSAYWLYLAHLPLVIWAQVAIRNWDLSAAAKFLGLTTVVTVVLLISYQLFVRYTPVGTLLNGKRERPADATPVAPDSPASRHVAGRADGRSPR